MRFTTVSRLSAFWMGPIWAAATLITRMKNFLVLRGRFAQIWSSFPDFNVPRRTFRLNPREQLGFWFTLSQLRSGSGLTRICSAFLLVRTSPACLGACPSSGCSNLSESDSSLGYEQVFSPLEYRSDTASAAECAGLRAERPCLAVYR